MNDYERKQEERRERLLALADSMQRASDAAYQHARKMADVIPFGQPILVGHHSEKRDRNYRARIWRTQDRCLELKRKAEHFRSMAESVGKGGISSDDPDAVSKLREELTKYENLQEKMKRVNAIVRKFKNDPHNGHLAIEQAGFTCGVAARAFKPDFAGRLGFPDYAMKNNNANIRRIKERIETLKKNATRETKERAFGEITLREDAEENRVMLLFPGKPAEDVRAKLKSAGFRWSPDRGAWVRQLNDSAVYQAAQIARDVSLKCSCGQPAPEAWKRCDACGML